MLRELLRQVARRAPAAKLDVPAALARMEGPPPPVIVVPIYNAARELRDCIASVLRHTPPGVRIVAIDDASTDPAVAAVLAEFGETPHLERRQNEQNLGFTATINNGIDLAGDADVVLLNSDIMVGPRWLQNLRLAAYSGKRVGTATPLSNNAGPFSAPHPGRANPLPDWLAFDDYARLVTQSAARTYPKVPTGHGFCMYVRRNCIAETGLFDAEAFPRGYGEENDFCMRAERRGWTHVVDDATLVYHVRSASFGADKQALMKAGRAIIDARYPDYAARVRDFASIAGLPEARDRIASALAESRRSGRPLRPRMLLVRTGQPGHQAASESAAVSKEWEAFELRCTAGRIELLAAASRSAKRPASAATTANGDRAEAERAVASWLVMYAIETAELSGTGFPNEVVEALCARLGIPT
jgi:GT2 family glycosyltransferase